MGREKINRILELYYASAEPLYDVLDNIPAEQFNWKPAPESRSINEIMCHLIRVDNSFLKRLNQVAKSEDPKNGSASDVLAALKKVHSQMSSLVNNCTDDSELFVKSNIQDAKETDTINEHVLHSSQHNLYHLAQVIYLRRALDRNWKSPIEKWDKATRIIAKYI